MNTNSTAKRVAGLLILSLVALSLASCGDETAPPGATISAPGDGTVEYDSPGVSFVDQTAAPLQFQVLDQNGAPLPGVKIRFFGGSETVALSQRGIPDPLSLSFTPLNANDWTFFETTTDERGLSPTDVYANWIVSACPVVVAPATPEDITGNATVMASVGSASAIWTVTITSKCT